MVKYDNTFNWRHSLYPHTTEHTDKDKHVCNGVNLILHLASIAVTPTHAGWNKRKSIPYWLIPPTLIPLSPSVCLCWHAATPSRSADSYFPLTGTSDAYVVRNVGNTPAFSPELESSTQRQIAMLECATEPYNPHLPGQATEEGGNDRGMEGQRERGKEAEW